MTNSVDGIDRRTTLKAIGMGLAVVPAAAGAVVPAGTPAVALEQAFRAAFGTVATKLESLATDRLAFLADPALIIDSDVPFPLDRAAYADHLGFHAVNWERLEMKFYDLKVAIHGATGIVSAFFNQRGKPLNAGFRLRAGYCTAVCIVEGGQWRAIGLHFGALSGQITDASPS